MAACPQLLGRSANACLSAWMRCPSASIWAFCAVSLFVSLSSVCPALRSSADTFKPDRQKKSASWQSTYSVYNVLLRLHSLVLSHWRLDYAEHRNSDTLHTIVNKSVWYFVAFRARGLVYIFVLRILCGFRKVTIDSASCPALNNTFLEKRSSAKIGRHLTLNHFIF